MKSLPGLDALARDNGFDNYNELQGMVNSVDISTPAKLNAFKKWQYEDGSRKGLLAIIEAAEQTGEADLLSRCVCDKCGQPHNPKLVSGSPKSANSLP